MADVISMKKRLVDDEDVDLSYIRLQEREYARLCPSAHRAEVAGATNFSSGTLAMKIERFAGHNEAREALLLSVAGVTAIMLIANLLLLILY